MIGLGLARVSKDSASGRALGMGRPPHPIQLARLVARAQEERRFATEQRESRKG